MCLIPYAVLDRLVADGVDVSELFGSADASGVAGNDVPPAEKTGRAVVARPVSGSFFSSNRSVPIPVRSINRVVPEQSSV